MVNNLEKVIAICVFVYYYNSILITTTGVKGMAKTKSHKGNKIGIEGIGRLEAEIMAVVWDLNKEVTVREVYETLRKKKKIAYTTIMTVMNNLAEKGLLEQDKTATAYIYKPTKSKIEVARSLVATVVDKILQGSVDPLASYFSGKK